VGYFRELLKTNPDINDSLRSLLQLCRETQVRLQKILAGNPNSIFCKATSWPRLANGCLVLLRAETTAERHYMDVG